MSLASWNWRLAPDLQDVPWDCAATSLSWCLRAYGVELSESDVVAGLGPSRISPAYGLLDASGAGIVEYLGELGIPAANNPNATWTEVNVAAGYQPMLIGGRRWCHWVGVRISDAAFTQHEGTQLALMNPAPGWMGVWQTLAAPDFEYLGDFSAVWFPGFI